MPHTSFVSDATDNDFILFCDDVRRISRWKALFSTDCPVSALRISPASSDDSERRDVVLSVQAALYDDSLPNGPYVSMFLAHAPWQPNNRIINYRKIWKSVVFEKLQLPLEIRGPEVRFESKDGVRYATVMHVGEDLFEVAANILTESSFASFFLRHSVRYDDDSAVQALFEHSFPLEDDGAHSTYVDWGNVIYWASSNRNVIGKSADKVGDLRYAVDLFGNANEVSTAFQKHVSQRYL